MSYRVFGDWGTTRLRLYRVEEGHVTARLEGRGIGQLNAPPEATLRDTIAPWRALGDPESIILAGMVGSRNGWHEVDYVACPAGRDAWAAGSARLAFDDIPVLIAPGLSHAEPQRHDVMRGEEAQIFGAMIDRPDLATGRHLMVLPGTHSKWVVVENRRIVGFTTFLTGEIFALLRDHSTLLSASPGATSKGEDDIDGFEAGLNRVALHEALLATLFEVRTSQLLGARPSDWARSFLSGLLIGSEIEAVAPTIEGGQQIYIVGEPILAEKYRYALDRLGTASTMLDAEICVIRGLSLLGNIA